jgi:hypothetical protein
MQRIAGMLTSELGSPFFYHQKGLFPRDRRLGNSSLHKQICAASSSAPFPSDFRARDTSRSGRLCIQLNKRIAVFEEAIGSSIG